MSFLIDTDVCSLFMRGNPHVVKRFFQYGGQLHVSVVTVGELYSGALRSRASPRLLSSLTQLLGELHILDAGFDVAFTFGTIRASILDQGLPGPDLDLLIAATALVHDLTLVTHNTAHYASVPGLRLADWAQP
jgi:predicted nucleic acid-binding protein